MCQGCGLMRNLSAGAGDHARAGPSTVVSVAVSLKSLVSAGLISAARAACATTVAEPPRATPGDATAVSAAAGAPAGNRPRVARGLDGKAGDPRGRR